MAAVLERPAARMGERSLGLLAVGAALAFCWLARALLIPAVLGVFAAYAVQPVVTRLERWKVPRWLAAVAGTLLAVLVVAALAALLWSQLLAFSNDLPAYEQRARQLARLALRHFARIQEQSEQLVPLAPGTLKVESAVPWGTLALGASTYAARLAAQAVVAVFTLYFALADGPRYAEKLLAAAKTPEARARVRAALEGIHRDVGQYLVNRAVLNAAVGLVTGVAFALYGLQHPAIWGITTGLAHFVPYLGTSLGLLLPLGMALVQYESLRDPLVVAGIYVVIVTIQGNVVDPIFIGKQLRLNSLAVFLGSLFWYWIWGPIGLFLAAPLLSAIRVVCAHVPRLRLTAELLGS